MRILRKVLKQTSFQLFGKFSSALSTFIILGLISRKFGETGAGVYTLAFTYLSFFYLAADLGLNGFVLPKVSIIRNDANYSVANKIFNFRFAWSSLLSAVSLLILLLTTFFSKEVSWSVFLGLTTIVSFGLFNSANLIFQHKVDYKDSTIASAAGSVAAAVAAFFLNFVTTDVVYFALAPVFGWVINNLVAIFLVRKFYIFKLESPDFSYNLNLLKNSWPVALTLLINTVYFRVDTFILANYKSIQDVGTYNLSYQFFQTALVFPTFMMNGFYPIMLNSLKENMSLFLKQIKLAGVLMAAAGFLGLVVTFLIGPILIKLLTGGGFSGAERSLSILALSFPAFFLSSLLIWTFMSLREYKRMLLIYVFGFFVNMVLNLIFIPKYSYIAAAYITGISEYLILTAQIIILTRLLKKGR